MFGVPTSALVNLLQNGAMLFGAGLVAKGYFSGDQLSAIVTGIVTAIVVVLNIVTHNDALKTPVPTVEKPSA
jgi:hypothetical protein